MRKRKTIPFLQKCLSLFVVAAMTSGPGLLAQASNLRVNNEKPEKGGQSKRIHPHGLKLILQGKKKEAIAYLNKYKDDKVNPEQTQMLIDLALEKPNAWKFDAKTWPWKRTLPNTSLKKDAPSDKFTIAFGGGAGYVPKNERIWDTIGAIDPRALLLLGDNVYSDDPTSPAMQHYCYYRRQSRPEFRSLLASTPVYSIWDDHDFGTNDCSGGPAIDEPIWKRPVYNVFRDNWVNPYFGGGDGQPGCFYDFYLGDIHFIMIDGRFYRDLKPEDGGMPTMLGPVQRAWLKNRIRHSKGRILALCSPVPWVFEAKGDSRDTWNGFKDERKEIFDVLSTTKKRGVVLISADRHRSDLWKIERPKDYPLYEFNSSRLTNQHVHKEMPKAEFSYNKKQSFGLIDFDTTLTNPTITYRIMSIDGEEVFSNTIELNDLQ